jgi:predicted anti-sigma-YlaC factor YlaD
MLLDASGGALLGNRLTVMPDERAVPRAAPVRRALWLRIVGWAAYAIALALLVVFVVLWIRGDISKGQQLYPLPGFATGFLIIGVWTYLGSWLYKSRSTATRVGKYVLAVLVSVGIFPTAVTLVSAVAGWIVSLIPGSPLH